MRLSSPRLLFLGHDLPWPVITGGRIRDAELLAAASAEWHIDAVVIAEPEILTRDRPSIPPLSGATVHAFADESHEALWPGRESRHAREAIESLCARGVDVVHVEGSYMLHLVPPSLLGRTVLVEHNIESKLLEQRRALAPDDVTERDIRVARAREERAWGEVTQLVTLTEEDATAVRARRPDLQPIVVPNGWDHVPLSDALSTCATRRLLAPRLLFFANHHYAPNRDALRWLVESVFPLVQRVLPRSELEVAGANLDDETRARLDRPGITVTGSFSDVTAVLDAADIVLCPLRVGGGIKVKMTEALRRGCTVVTTSVGAQGIHGRLRRGLAIGDSAEALAEHVVRLCDPAERTAASEHLAAGIQDSPHWYDSFRQMSSLWTEVSMCAWTSR